jgi:cytochrome c biogenesis protein CcdA/thiol-disulfide isomerase/thioredoxin
MALLMVFALVAGAATAVSPCVLPVLPVALSAGATGGRSRPLGIVAGLTVSFTFATVALVYVISALGLPDGLVRTLAICVLIGFGLVLVVPALGERVEAPLSRLAGRVRVPSGGEGFWSGVLVGASLGLVYAPCAGPILAGVITVSASQPFTAGRLAVAFSYGIGSAIVLYALMLGGRRLTAPLGRRGGALQVAAGAVMILVAAAMLAEYDIRFQNAIASDLPAFLVNPSKDLESSAAAEDAIQQVRGEDAHGVGARALAAQEAAGAGSGRTEDAGGEGKASGLPVLGPAPEFVDTQRWFNTPGGRPLTMRGLRGRVVLVDIWTYSCINCLRTLPWLKAWDARYRRAGLTIVGVHSPEFPFEKDAGNVAAAIERNGIRYPVVQDNDLATWRAWGNQYWPAEYFVDTRGQVRFAHFGEGAYGEKEHVIRELLAEAGHPPGSGSSGARGMTASAGVTTPETYLGTARAERFANPRLSPGLHDFADPGEPGPDEFAYRGRWWVGFDSARAGGGSLALRFGARRVYLVLGTEDGGARRMRVLLDGQPIPAALAGSDVRDGVATIGAHRLYDLVDLPGVGRHLLTLEPEAGIEAYAFTFG